MPLLELEEVVVGGPCSSATLVTLLSLGLNLRRIQLGASVQATDTTMAEVIEANRLQHLHTFEARDPQRLSMETATFLLDSCPALTTLLDLSSWGRVTEEELAELRRRVRRENLEVELGEEVGYGEREVTIFQLCRNALREKYGRVAHWEGEE